MKLNIIQYLSILMLLGNLSLLSSCKEDKGHDASSPVVVNRFYPTVGSAGTEILITGKNFSNNPEEVSVTLGKTPLKVLDCNLTNILAIVPAKLGNGNLTITIAGRESVQTLEQFAYSFSAIVSTFAGNGEFGYQDGKGNEAMFYFDDSKNGQGWRRGSICVDNDCNVYVGDAVNSCIRKITPDGTVSTLAGYAGVYDCVDGIGLQARFGDIYGMDCDAEGNIFLTDVINWRIRKVTPEGVVTTIKNTGFEPWSLAVDKRNGELFVSRKDGGIYKCTSDTETKISDAPTLGVAVDGQGNVYGADQSKHGIVKYKAGTWEAEVLVGNGVAGYTDGPFKEARFANPSGVSVDSSGNIYVAGNGSWNGGDNPDQSIRQLDMNNRTVRTIAGSARSGYNDANGISATFSGPVDLAVDKNGVIYIYDKMNNVIRKIVYE